MNSGVLDLKIRRYVNKPEPLPDADGLPCGIKQSTAVRIRMKRNIAFIDPSGYARCVVPLMTRQHLHSPVSSLLPLQVPPGPQSLLQIAAPVGRFAGGTTPPPAHRQHPMVHANLASPIALSP